MPLCSHYKISLTLRNNVPLVQKSHFMQMIFDFTLSKKNCHKVANMLTLSLAFITGALSWGVS